MDTILPRLKSISGISPPILPQHSPPKEANAKPTDGSFHVGLQKWLAEKGNNILYIYGGIDAWSAARVIVSDQVNSKSFLIPGAHHATARIKNLPDAMKREFVEKIKEWTGLDGNLDVLKSK